MEISVIITNYNYGKFLPRCIRSLLNQSYNKEEYEVVIIDDCSTDNSLDVLDNFRGVRVIQNQENLGLAASCNVAIRQAMGKYIIRVDADDYIHRDCLKVHQLFLSHNKSDMDATSSDYLEVDLNEDVLRRKNGVTWPIACGIMYRADHIAELGLYDESLPREDVEFRQRFLKKYQIYNIPVPLYRYTIHEDSKTRGQ